MKKVFLFLIISIFFSNFTNAQNLQNSMYNDGRLLAYIDERVRNSVRSDRLVLKNLSEQIIIVTYRFKTVATWYDEFMDAEIRTSEQTLQPGEQYTASSYFRPRGKGNNDCVDSFAIMNISIKSTSSQSDNNSPHSNLAVPRELIGTWTYFDSYLIITANQLQIVLAGDTVATIINGVSILNNTKAGFPRCTTKRTSIKTSCKMYFS